MRNFLALSLASFFLSFIALFRARGEGGARGEAFRMQMPEVDLAKRPIFAPRESEERTHPRHEGAVMNTECMHY